MVESEPSEKGRFFLHFAWFFFIWNLQVCEESDDDGGGISIHNIGGVFIVIFVGKYLFTLIHL